MSKKSAANATTRRIVAIGVYFQECRSSSEAGAKQSTCLGVRQLLPSVKRMRPKTLAVIDAWLGFDNVAQQAYADVSNVNTETHERIFSTPNYSSA